MRIVKILGGVSIAVVCAAALGGYIVYAKTDVRMRNTFVVASESFPIPTDAASIARGRHLADSLAGCTQCHGPDLGGKIEADVPFLFTGRVPNITQGEGSRTIGYTDADWIRTVRHGINRAGRPLIMMPSNAFANMTTEDVGAIIAAVKTFPPVNRQMDPPTIGPLGRVLLLTGAFKILAAENIDHARPAPAAVSFATAADHGKYLVAAGGCADCHRTDLSGGRIPGTPSSLPPAANLTPAGPLATFTEADFIHLFRTGKKPDGTPVNDMMPWVAVGRMTDRELGAVFAYLKTVPPAQTQNPD